MATNTQQPQGLGNCRESHIPQVLTISTEEGGKLVWLDGPSPDMVLEDENKTFLDLTRLAEYAPDPALEGRRISFLIAIARATSSFHLVDTQASLPPHFAKQLSDLASKGYDRFIESMMHFLGDSAGKPHWHCQVMWALVTKLTEQGRVGTQCAVKTSLDALEARCKEMVALVDGLSSLSVDQSAKLPNTKLTTVLTQLKAAHVLATSALHSADVTGEPSEIIKESQALQFHAKAALTQFGMSKLLKVTLIKNVDKGIALRAKLSELVGIALKPELKVFISPSLLDSVAEVSPQDYACLGHASRS